MEAVVLQRNWEDFGQAAGLFEALHSEKGEDLVFNQNFFVEAILPRGMLRTLTEQEMAAYRAPYRQRAARLPTLMWPRQIPINGEPPEVTAIVEEFGRWLAQSTVPKLLVVGDPGAIMTIAGKVQLWCHVEFLFARHGSLANLP